MVEKMLDALDSQNWEEARWLADAILRMNGISKVQSSKGSTKTTIPLSAADLPTLLDMLLETRISTGVSKGSTWKSKLKSLVKSLPSFSNTDFSSGQEQGQRAAGSPQQRRPLPSRRRYWPGEAKDVFWNLVRSLNKYDKEHAPQGKKSPIQLAVAEEITRRWWEIEYGHNG